MNKPAWFCFFIFLFLVVSLPTGAAGFKYGGFDIDFTVTGAGEGTFDISGETDYGAVNVSGAFSSVKDPHSGTMTISVAFDTGSTATTADGNIMDLSCHTFSYSGTASIKGIIFTIVGWLKSLIED